jgi:diguanylate cyclase (GGDEF)-like protein
MERCNQAGKPLSLVFVDSDSFKKINDDHGRPAGDTILLKIASRLRSCIRPHDALGRYDGGKFMIILPGASHVIALAVAERMRLAIMSHPEAVGQAAIHLTVSAGTASTDQFPLARPDELTNHADAALYSAKNAGRNRVVQATPNSFI